MSKIDKKKHQPEPKHILTPILRLAKLFETPTPTKVVEETESQELAQLRETHKNYLDYRQKTEAIATNSRLELDKTLLTLSVQGIVITFAVLNAFHPVHQWQIHTAWHFWCGAILTTMLSMLIAEYASEKLRSILDDSYDIAKEKHLPSLPVAEALEKRSGSIRWLIDNNAAIMSTLNYAGPVCFIIALGFAVRWMMLIRGI